MTLNGVMAVILRCIIEFGNFGEQLLCKGGCILSILSATKM